MIKKLFILLAVTPFISFNTFAENSGEDIDPSDLTNVYTQAAIMVSGNSNVMPVAMVSGGYDNGHQFAFMAEAKFGNTGDNGDNEFGLEYGSSRFQYFQVADTGVNVMPRAGLSVDYINIRASGLKSDLLALGGVGAINHEYTPGFMLFPIASYVYGRFDVAGIKDEVDGINVSLAASIPLGSSGAFMMIWPEYRKLSGSSVETENLSTKLIVNVPLTSDRKWWINTRLELDHSDLSVSGIELQNQWNSDVYMGIRYFF